MKSACDSLITGAAGFIGMALAERLSRNEDRRLLLVDRVDPGQIDKTFAHILNRQNVEYRCLDLMDRNAVLALPKQVDTIYHLAAVIGVEQVLSAPDKVLEVNAVSTINLFRYAEALPSLSRVLFSSTSEVYSGTLKHYGIALPTPEDVPLCLDDVSSSRTSYALSKIYGEAVAFAWQKIHGIPITIVRYHNVYGPRMGFRHVIPQTFVKILLSDGVIDVPSANHTRSFCYIDDAVEATIFCAEGDKTEGCVIHIGSSREEVSIRDLVGRIGVVMGRSLLLREMPETPGSPARRCPDTSMLARLTGFQAEVGLHEGLGRTYEWYKGRM
jgi:nucleoside-diphosphate-sugar epimerase